MYRRLNEAGGCKSVQVTNIDPRVDEALLNQVFSSAGQITSIRIHPDKSYSHGGRASATIDFVDHTAAETAICTLNTRKIFDSPIKVQWALQNSNLTPAGTRKENTSMHFHLYVGELSQDVDDKTLWDAFVPFGSLSDARVMWDPANGKSRGYGFVSYRDRTDAERAMSQMNGKALGKKSLRINWAHQRGAAALATTGATGISGSISSGSGGDGAMTGRPNFMAPSKLQSTLGQIMSQTQTAHSTIYIGNIPPSVTSEDLKPLFQQYGHVMDVHSHLDKGYIFFKMDSHENAANAILYLNGTMVDGSKLRISWGKDKDAEQLAFAQHQFYGMQAAAVGYAAYGTAAGQPTQYYPNSAQPPLLDVAAAQYYAQYFAQLGDQQGAAYFQQYAQQLINYQQQYGVAPTVIAVPPPAAPQ